MLEAQAEAAKTTTRGEKRKSSEKIKSPSKKTKVGKSSAAKNKKDKKDKKDKKKKHKKEVKKSWGRIPERPVATPMDQSGPSRKK